MSYIAIHDVNGFVFEKSLHRSTYSLFNMIWICHRNDWKTPSFQSNIQTHRAFFHGWWGKLHRTDRLKRQQTKPTEKKQDETCAFGYRWSHFIDQNRRRFTQTNSWTARGGEDRVKKEPTAINNMEKPGRWKTAVFWYACEWMHVFRSLKWIFTEGKQPTIQLVFWFLFVVFHICCHFTQCERIKTNIYTGTHHAVAVTAASFRLWHHTHKHNQLTLRSTI